MWQKVARPLELSSTLLTAVNAGGNITDCYAKLHLMFTGRMWILRDFSESLTQTMTRPFVQCFGNVKKEEKEKKEKQRRRRKKPTN